MPSIFLSLTRLGDLLDQTLFIDHVGDFTDDDLFFPRALDRLGEGLAAHLHDAFAFVVGLHDRLFAVNESAGGKIRPRNMPHQLLDRNIGIFDQRDQAVDHFAQIMRRNIGRHADGDSRGAIDQADWECATAKPPAL